MDDRSASSSGSASGSASASVTPQENQLIEAVFNEDYDLLKEWIKNNLLDITSEKLLLTLKAKTVAGKLIRVAAHKGKTVIVDLLRKHGKDVQY